MSARIPPIKRQHWAHVEAYHAYLRSAPWFVYLLKYAASGIAFYAGSSKRAKRLSEHIRAAMKGGSDATQRDLHAVIRFQILVLGQKPILEKVFVRISTNREAGALIETLGTSS